MSIDMSSHAMIGVKFTPTVKQEEVRERGCNHAETQDSFCSNCGEKMWIKGTKTTHQFEYIHDEFVDPILDEIEACFDGYAVVTWDYDGVNYYIGYGTTVENHEVASFPILDIAVIKNKLQPILEKYGIWDQCKDSFGFWALSTGC